MTPETIEQANRLMDGIRDLEFQICKWEETRDSKKLEVCSKLYNSSTSRMDYSELRPSGSPTANEMNVLTALVTVRLRKQLDGLKADLDAL